MIFGGVGSAHTTKNHYGLRTTKMKTERDDFAVTMRRQNHLGCGARYT